MSVRKDQLIETHKFIQNTIINQNITPNDKILLMGDLNIDAYNFTKRPDVITMFKYYFRNSLIQSSMNIVSLFNY